MDVKSDGVGFILQFGMALECGRGVDFFGTEVLYKYGWANSIAMIFTTAAIVMLTRPTSALGPGFKRLLRKKLSRVLECLQKKSTSL